MTPKIGIIGGSGIYQIEGLEETAWRAVDTPFGPPSDAVLTGRLGGVEMVFLPRHGRGHVQSPSSVNYRANIAAMKLLGVTEIVALSAVGSLQETYAPGDFLLVDQYIDRTFAREKSFFGAGLVGHVPFSHPTCARLSALAADAAHAAGVKVHRAGTYVAMEGPQFSTLAESRLYRQWGADVIGMTGMPEAKLAREAEICYACVAMITDYDCWHPEHDAVDVAQVIATLGRNSGNAKATVAGIAQRIAARAACPCGCERALDAAIMTATEARDAQMVERLRPLMGRVL